MACTLVAGREQRTGEWHDRMKAYGVEVIFDRLLEIPDNESCEIPTVLEERRLLFRNSNGTAHGLSLAAMGRVFCQRIRGIPFSATFDLFPSTRTLRGSGENRWKF